MREQSFAKLTARALSAACLGDPSRRIEEKPEASERSETRSREPNPEPAPAGDRTLAPGKRA